MRRSLVSLSLIAVLAALPAAAGPKGCPPGLAKKSPACVPPGLARKGVREGIIIEGYPYHLVRHPDRYGLGPLRDGELYYVVDGHLLRVDRDTYRVIEVIRTVTELFD